MDRKTSTMQDIETERNDLLELIKKNIPQDVLSSIELVYSCTPKIPVPDTVFCESSSFIRSDCANKR